VNGGLDEHEDGSTEDCGDGGSHDETSENGTETRTIYQILSVRVRHIE
jgi:hypothetical protein